MQDASVWLVVERWRAWFDSRYCWRVVPELFNGPRTIEDLPIYAWTKVLLRAMKIKARNLKNRPMSRPDDLDARLEERTPQFFLRNIRRVERTVEDRPEMEVVRTRDGESAPFRMMRYEPPQFLERWNMDHVKWLRALIRRYVYEEDWRRHFCRELKESIQGPLFKYDPDKQTTGLSQPLTGLL